MSLGFDSYLDACSEELERALDALEVAGPQVPVPTCPGWTTGDLATHLRQVYGRWRQRLADGGTVVLAPTERGGDAPAGEAGEDPPRPADGFYEEGNALLGELAAAGPEAACWNWTGIDETAGWLARRIALETAVHRVDAELAAGTSRPVEAELAVEGIEERLEVHLRQALARAPEAGLGGSLCLVCSDVDAAFVVEAGGGRLRWRRGRGPADAALVGTASQLFLFSWNRFPLDALSLTGRREIVSAWADLPA